MSSKHVTLEPAVSTQTPYPPEEFTTLYEEMYPRALRFARVAYGHEEKAEDAVAKAFLKIWELGVPRRYILRIVRQVILNDHKRAAIERGIITRSVDAWTGGQRAGKRPPSLTDTAVSRNPEDADPLEIQILAEAKRSAYEEVGGESKHRWVRQLKWWKELDEHYCGAAA